MSEVTGPGALDERFANTLRSPKSTVVRATSDGVAIEQHGAALLAHRERPPWPTTVTESAGQQPIIETYVCGAGTVTATSDNEPFVSAWLPLVDWMNSTVRNHLARVSVAVSGDAYVTASVTPTALLEGVAHMDDDIYEPDASAQMVAIMAQLAGPRIATSPIGHGPLRPFGQVTFSESTLAEFAAGTIAQCRCEADQLVVFPQFGQLHAGPTAKQVAHLSCTRQLLVMRAATVARPT